MSATGGGAPDRQKSGWARADKIAILAVVTTVVVAVGSWLVSRLDIPSTPSGSIVNIEDRLKVTSDALFVTGEAHDVPRGSEVWIVVQAKAEGKWYPVKAVDISADGTWSSDGDADRPRDVRLTTEGEYAIEIYSADSTAIAAFRAYKSEAVGKETYDGMAILPEGARILDAKQVQRVLAGP